LPHANFLPFRCLPLQVRFRQQHGFLRVYATVNDALLHDKAINASVHDSLSAPRITPRMRLPSAHNDVCAFHAALRMLRDNCAALKESKSTVFVALEPTACIAWMEPSLRSA
jgi:7-keto-8-aminopelargonate synthetase-like enzyme